MNYSSRIAGFNRKKKIFGFVMSQSIARGLLRHYTTLWSDDGLRRASREHERGWVPWRKIFHIRHEKNDIYSDHMCL